VFVVCVYFLAANIARQSKFICVDSFYHLKFSFISSMHIPKLSKHSSQRYNLLPIPILANLIARTLLFVQYPTSHLISMLGFSNRIILLFPPSKIIVRISLLALGVLSSCLLACIVAYCLCPIVGLCQIRYLQNPSVASTHEGLVF